MLRDCAVSVRSQDLNGGNTECFAMEAYPILLELILEAERVLTKPETGTIEDLFADAA